MSDAYLKDTTDAWGFLLCNSLNIKAVVIRIIRTDPAIISMTAVVDAAFVCLRIALAAIEMFAVARFEPLDRIPALCFPIA